MLIVDIMGMMGLIFSFALTLLATLGTADWIIRCRTRTSMTNART